MLASAPETTSLEELASLADKIIEVATCAPAVSAVTAPGLSTEVEQLCTEISDLKNFPRPNSQRKLREFLGLINFYHRFIHNCA